MSRIRKERRRAGQSTRRCGVALLLATTLAACQADSPTSARVEVHAASLAKGAGTSALGVTATLPTSARQDTTLDVNIYGSGFTSGAAASWSLAGDTTKVHVQSTKFVNQGQLVARLLVPAAAPVASYDVVVMLIGGKKGVGAELFAVTVGDPSATYLFPFNDPTLGIQGDGQFTSGTYSVYANSVCGTTTRIYATTEASNSGDMMFQTFAPHTKDQRCAMWPRRFRVTFPDGFSELTYSTTNLQRVENTTFQIPVGGTVKRQLNMGTGESVRCTGIRWGANTGSSVVGDSVLVTRTALDTWHVQTQPPPNNRGVCLSSSPTAYNLSVDFWVISARPLP
jgi:hypothetical protein